MQSSSLLMKPEDASASCSSSHPTSSYEKFARGLLILASLIGVAAARPVNDDFADRTLIPAIPATVFGDTTGATTEVGDPVSQSIWWKFTPQQSGSYFISAYPDYTNAFRLHLYTGNSLGSLVKQNGQLDTTAPTYTWLEKFELTAGVEYSILAAAGVDWDFRPITLSITRNAPPTIAVTNPTNGIPYYTGSQLELRVNANDPDGSIARVDYYFDLYYQEGVSQPIAGSTVPPFSTTITLPQGGGYYQNVYAVATDDDGAKAASGSISFLITYNTANDFFVDRKPITGEQVFESGNTQYATTEAGEAGGQKSIWWSWTAPASKTYVISGRGWPGGFQPKLDVYQGSSLNALTSVGSSGPYGSNVGYTAQVVLNATAGQTYAVRVTTVLGQGGDMSLSILPSVPIGNAPKIESIRLINGGKIEFLISSNSAVLTEFQASPDLKSWIPYSLTYPPNGIFKEVLPRTAAPAYFYRVVEKASGH